MMATDPPQIGETVVVGAGALAGAPPRPGSRVRVPLTSGGYEAVIVCSAEVRSGHDASEGYMAEVVASWSN